MRRGVVIIGLIVGIALLMIVSVGAVSWSPTTEKVDLGPKPIALINSYLALEKYLEKRYGCEVVSKFSIDYGDDDNYYDLIVMPVEALPLHPDVWYELEQLLYEESLVVTGFTEHDPQGSLPSQYETPGVLQRIGVNALNPAEDEDPEPDVYVGTAEFGTYAYSSFYNPEFARQPDPDAPYGTAPGFATLHNLEMLTNDQIGTQNHVMLLDSLLGDLELDEYSVVLVVHGRHVRSLWSWLFGAGLPLVLLTVALVALVIWHYAPRFGPLQPDPERGSRQLREHFLATARFFWRSGSVAHLLEPARRPLLETLRRRSGRAGEAELANLAATLSGLDPETVHHALFSREITKRTLAQVASTLQQLRQHL